MKERARRCDDDEGEESRAAGGGGEAITQAGLLNLCVC